MRALIALTVVLIAAPASIRAEKAPMSPKALEKTATHVVTGEVRAVYSLKSTEGRWRYTRYVAELRVDTVEKGDGLAKGDLVYVRYWTRRWGGSGAPPPSASGHSGLPDKGASVRVYMARNAYDGFGKTDDGGFNVIGANGFGKLAKQGG